MNGREMADKNKREVTITRIFDAPRELVWKAWTDPKLVAQWWGPHGFTNHVCKVDVRPGGALNIHIRGPDGVAYPGKGVFHEIVEPERLVFTTSAFENEEGHPGLEVLNTVTFAEHNGKTKLTLQAVVVQSTPEAAAALDGMEEGWRQSLDKLAEHLGYLKGEIMMAANNQENVTAVPEMKLELVPVPVSDVDRAKAFYVEKVGFNVDLDVQPGNGMRVVQLTPPGSSCSIVIGTGLGEISEMQPGTVKALHLVVADITKAREELAGRGVKVGEVDEHPRGIKYVHFSDPDGNTWLLQEIPANL